jgi:hypothetical protein
VFYGLLRRSASAPTISVPSPHPIGGIHGAAATTPGAAAHPLATNAIRATVAAAKQGFLARPTDAALAQY